MSDSVLTRDIRVEVVLDRRGKYTVTLSSGEERTETVLATQARAEEFIAGVHRVCKMFGLTTFTTFENRGGWHTTFTMPAD